MAPLQGARAAYEHAWGSTSTEESLDSSSPNRLEKTTTMMIVSMLIFSVLFQYKCHEVKAIDDDALTRKYNAATLGDVMNQGRFAKETSQARSQDLAQSEPKRARHQ